MNEIIEKAKAGDKSSFTKLYNMYEKDVFYTVYYIVKDEDVAKDLVSEIFLKIYQNLSKFKEDISFKMWLKTVATNYGIDYLRKKKRSNEVTLDEYTFSIENSTDSTPLSTIVDREERIILKESIENLKEPYRSIIELRLEGKRYEDISKELNINLGTLKSYINFAKKKIQKFSKKCE